MLSNLRAKLQGVLEKQENEPNNSDNLTLAQQFEQERELPCGDKKSRQVMLML